MGRLRFPDLIDQLRVLPGKMLPTCACVYAAHKAFQVILLPSGRGQGNLCLRRAVLPFVLNLQMRFSGIASAAKGGKVYPVGVCVPLWKEEEIPRLSVSPERRSVINCGRL